MYFLTNKETFPNAENEFEGVDLDRDSFYSTYYPRRTCEEVIEGLSFIPSAPITLRSSLH